MVTAETLKTDITPESLAHIYVAGFSHTKPAVGVYKPIFARFLCLEGDGGPLVMVPSICLEFPSQAGETGPISTGS